MKLFFLLWLAGLCSMRCLAQADTAAAPATDSVVSKSTLTLGAVYSNNANYYGQKALERVPYAALAATYRLRSGFYFSGLAYRLLNDTGSAVSAGNAGIGYGFAISKRFSADINYSHTFYPAHSPFLQAGNPENASVSLTYNRWLSTKINADYAFGKTQDVFLTAGTGKEITLGSFSPKDVISITPSADVTAGTQHFYQTYVTEKKLRDSLAGILLSPLLGSPSPGAGTRTSSSTQFNILSYNFKLPLSYSRAHYMVQAEYQLSVLSNKAETAAGKVNSFFSAGFYYQF